MAPSRHPGCESLTYTIGMFCLNNLIWSAVNDESNETFISEANAKFSIKCHLVILFVSKWFLSEHRSSCCCCWVTFEIASVKKEIIFAILFLLCFSTLRNNFAQKGFVSLVYHLDIVPMILEYCKDSGAKSLLLLSRKLV